MLNIILYFLKNPKFGIPHPMIKGILKLLLLLREVFEVQGSKGKLRGYNTVAIDLVIKLSQICGWIFSVLLCMV